MDWDEFEERGAERRRKRTIYPRKPDRVTTVVGCAIGCLVVVWIVWGVMA